MLCSAVHGTAVYICCTGIEDGEADNSGYVCQHLGNLECQVCNVLNKTKTNKCKHLVIDRGKKRGYIIPNRENQIPNWLYFTHLGILYFFLWLHRHDSEISNPHLVKNYSIGDFISPIWDNISNLRYYF